MGAGALERGAVAREMGGLVDGLEMPEPKRPVHVPTEAVWNANDNEWELGSKNAAGKPIGEWRWWLAPNGHLVCQTFFDDQGAILRSKRFHPNGEVSRQIDSATHLDEYTRSTGPTTENFAYGTETADVWKAIKRQGYPVEFDYYDREGALLNPKIEPCELRVSLRSFDHGRILTEIKARAKSAKAGQLDAGFAERVMALIGDAGATTPLAEAMLDEIVNNETDTLYHEGSLELEDLSDWDALGISNLIVNGNLTIKNSLVLSDDPGALLVVLGNLSAANVQTAGGLVVTGDLQVSGCLFGDYNHGSTYVRGSLSARLFYPEEYFFEVCGETAFAVAFGNSYRLNENERPEAFNFNAKPASEFFALLDDRLRAQIDLSVASYLSQPCSKACWKYVDWRSFMRYCLSGAPVFAQ
jgi:hypothetical protein